jgi:hypothetical protein
MTLCEMILGRMIFRRMTLDGMTFSRMTFSNPRVISGISTFKKMLAKCQQQATLMFVHALAFLD